MVLLQVRSAAHGRASLATLRNVPFYYMVSDDPLPIGYDDLDRFLDLVNGGLREALPSLSGNGSSSQPAGSGEPFHIRMSVTGAGFQSELCAAPVGDATILYLRSEHEFDAEEVMHWLKAVLQAWRRMAEEIPSVDWWAVIACSAEGGNPPALDEEYMIDNLALTPATSPYTDYMPPEIPQLPRMGSFEVHQRWPVIVHGKATAHSDGIALTAAARRLARLCALLSVATDHCWQLLQAPGTERLEPESLPVSRMSRDPFQLPEREFEQVTLPDWVAGGLDTFDNDAALEAALQSHHQGMMMERRFPSFAMIAYTAAIEAVGARSLPRGKPSQQYRHALKQIRTSKQRESLVRSYDLRSRTAHAGALHAAENVSGAFPLTGLVPKIDTSLLFRFLPLAESRQASRELLELAANGSLPPAILVPNVSDESPACPED